MLRASGDCVGEDRGFPLVARTGTRKVIQVISMHMQSRELIYKILFFADTTYAYLPGKQLRPFPSGDTEGQFKNDDQQLAKAIRMAHQSYAKSQAASQQSVLSCRQEPSGGECLKQSTVFAHRQEPILQNHVEGTIAEHDEQPHQMVDQSREKFDRIRSQQTMAIQHPERESFEQITEKQVQEIVTVQNIIEVLQRRMRVEPRFGYNYADRKNSIREKMLLKEKLLEKYNLHTLIRIPPSQQSFRNQQAQVTSIHPKRKGIRRVKMCKENSQINIASLQGQCLKKLYQSVRRIFCNRIASNSLKKISGNSLKKICQVSQNQSQNFKNIFANLLRFIYRLNPSQLQSESDLIGILSGYFDRLQGDKTQEQDGSKMTQVSIPIPDFNIDH